MEENVRSFLKKEGILSQNWVWKAEISRYLREMEQGLSGYGSLKMLPSYLGKPEEVPKGEPVIALDAGGTNLRIALVTFPEMGEPVVERLQTLPMPGSREKITVETFFETLAIQLKPYLKASEYIGFCFSYPVEIQPNLDGTVLEMAKQIQIQGIHGCNIADELQKSLKKLGVSAKRVILLNDSTAVLLAGTLLYKEKCSEIIGFILGTGMNAAYFETVDNITKVTDFVYHEMAINMEASCYDQIPGGMADCKYDKTLSDPGEFLYEKRVSGRYLGGLVLMVLKNAADEEFLSAFCAQQVKKTDFLSTANISEFLSCQSKGTLAQLCREEEDRQIFLQIIDAVLDRAAKLVAIHLASVIIKTGKGKNSDKPIGILVEGSTFHKFEIYQQKIKWYLKSILDERNLTVSFFFTENAALLGAAVAGLSNSIIK